MKSYTKKYMEAFSLCIDDFIGCEVCGSRANDIHHILARSKRKDLLNDINNIMAVCRSCHIEYGDKSEFMAFLYKRHMEFLQKRGVQFDKEYLIQKISQYENNEALI